MAEDDEREAAYFARITAKKTAGATRPHQVAATVGAPKSQPNLDNATLRTRTFAVEDARIEGAEEARLNRLLNKGTQVPTFPKSNEPCVEAPPVSLSFPAAPPSQPTVVAAPQAYVEESSSVTLSFPGPPPVQPTVVEPAHAAHAVPVNQVLITQAPAQQGTLAAEASPRKKSSSRDSSPSGGKRSREHSPRGKTQPIRQPSPSKKRSSRDPSPSTKRDPSPSTKRDPSPSAKSDPSPSESSEKPQTAATGGNSFAARQAMFEAAGSKPQEAPPPAKSAFANRQAMFEKASQPEPQQPVVKKKVVPDIAKSTPAAVPPAKAAAANPVANKAAATKQYNTMPGSAKPRTPAGARKLPEWQQVPAQVQHGTQYESTLLTDILAVRANPQSLIPALKSRILGFVGKNYLDPVSNCFMQTLEGEAGVLEAISFLQSQPPVDSNLKLEVGLSLSARDYCLINAGGEAAETNDQATARLTKYGDFSGELFQNVCYTNLPPDDMVQSWIIDDGNEGNRINREALFNPHVKCIGISSGPHGPSERVVCVLLAGGYEFGAVGDPDSSVQVLSGTQQHPQASQEHQPHHQHHQQQTQHHYHQPQQEDSSRPGGASAAKPGWNTLTSAAMGSTGGSAPPSSAPVKQPQQQQQQQNKPGWNTLKTATPATASPPAASPAPVKKTYPAISVGKLAQIDGNTATELVISNLGCTVTDLSVELRDNGTQLAFQRVCSSEGRLMGLPYQVTAGSCTATYSPNVNGGSLRLRFGKPTVPDYDVCTFFVKGDPNSNAERAVMQVISTNPACFEFQPGPAMPIDTNFTVKMSGTSLIFRTEPQCSTQTVNLPIPVTRNQIECIDLAPGKGKTIKIWHQKPAELLINQPNCSIQISVA